MRGAERRATGTIRHSKACKANLSIARHSSHENRTSGIAAKSNPMPLEHPRPVRPVHLHYGGEVD
jgi:hypothetical protein